MGSGGGSPLEPPGRRRADNFPHGRIALLTKRWPAGTRPTGGPRLWAANRQVRYVSMRGKTGLIFEVD